MDVRTHPMTEAELDALISTAFLADTPPPPAAAAIVAKATGHSQERSTQAWLRPKRGRIGWAAAGVFALLLGCGVGAVSRIVAVPGDLDLAFGAVAAIGTSNAG